MTDDDNTDDDAQLKQLRSVWLSMRDEEPSDSGLSALMAAAHQQAAVMRPKESFWSRTLAALRRPPVLAFASIAILVGGALVITQRKHADDMHVVQEAEPTTARPQVAPAAEPPPPPPDDLRAKSGAATEPPAVGSAPEGQAAPAPLEKSDKSHDAKVKSAVPGRSGAKHDEPTLRDPYRFGGGGEVPTTEAAPVAPPSPPRAAPPADALETDRETATSRAPAKKPAPARTPAPSIEGEDRVEAGTPTVAQLVKQCETAAAANNCAAVRALMKKIADQDPAQHKAKLATPAIARCF